MRGFASVRIHLWVIWLPALTFIYDPQCSALILWWNFIVTYSNITSFPQPAPVNYIVLYPKCLLPLIQNSLAAEVHSDLLRVLSMEKLAFLQLLQWISPFFDSVRHQMLMLSWDISRCDCTWFHLVTFLITNAPSLMLEQKEHPPSHVIYVCVLML